MKRLYFVSYCGPNGVFGYTFVDMKHRLHNWNMDQVQKHIEKTQNIESVVILNYKRVWWPAKKPKEMK